MRTFLFSIAMLLGPLQAAAQSIPASDWPTYGRDPGGSRFSPLTRITRDNVARLQVAWVYRTGDSGVQTRGRPPALEATPLMVDGTMYLSTPTGRVIALDPTTGRERWRFDPEVDPTRGYGDFASRGVSYWRDRRAGAGAPCARRIFFATIDARLVSLDAATGRLCDGFGKGGVLSLRDGLRVPPSEFQAYQMTSPPAIVGDLVITGSSIADNSRPNPASGEVRAYEARTGAVRWTFDPIPQDTATPVGRGWPGASARRTGGANAWSILVADPARDLVFVPTSSAAPDYFGGLRPGDNRYASSLVALRASTGAVVWHFQTVHHDLWDYDNAAPPALATVVRNGRAVPAVLQATKTGMLFVLDRETGEPVFPVEERPVPASDIPGETAWPTQPFTALTPPLSPHTLAADGAWGATEADRAWCRQEIAGLRNEGIFTPPSLRGTLVLPSNIGGAHWGGVAVDSARRVAIVPVNTAAAMVQLIPAEGAGLDSLRRGDAARGLTDFEYTRMAGTPYWMRRRILLAPSGLPCTPPPFGALVAVSLETGQVRWTVPLGTMPTPSGAPPAPADWGSPNLGGPIITGSGLVFIGATLDRAVRAYDVETGRELWKAALPAGARATPMTYEVAGRQYLVISAGGGGPFGRGDALVAFALPAR
jgi:quinoprotein glucose dehydrogenase